MTVNTDSDATASDASGDYVIAWTDDSTTANAGVWVNMYTQTAYHRRRRHPHHQRCPVEAIRVSSDPTATDISVACDAEGDFIVTWSQYNAATSWDVYAAMYDSTGTAIRSAFEVNTYTAGVQNDAKVAMDSSGDSTITWQSLGQDGSGYGIYARRFDLTGAAIIGDDASGEFRVNDTTAGNQMYPAVAMSDNGDAVVTWTSYGQASTPESAFAPGATKGTSTPKRSRSPLTTSDSH